MTGTVGRAVASGLFPRLRRGGTCGAGPSDRSRFSAEGSQPRGETCKPSPRRPSPTAVLSSSGRRPRRRPPLMRFACPSTLPGRAVPPGAAGPGPSRSGVTRAAAHPLSARLRACRRSASAVCFACLAPVKPGAARLSTAVRTSSANSPIAPVARPVGTRNPLVRTRNAPIDREPFESNLNGLPAGSDLCGRIDDVHVCADDPLRA